MRLPVTNVYVDTRKLLSFTLVAFMVGGLLGSVLWNFGGVYTPISESLQSFGLMKQFTSQEELKTFIQLKGRNAYYDSQSFPLTLGSGFSASSESDSGKIAINPVPARASGAGAEFSVTNVQVEGVDEADIVKTDGTYIYMVKNKNVLIIKSYPPEKAEIVYKLKLDFTIQDLYINGNKLVVFSHVYPNKVYSSNYWDEVFSTIDNKKEMIEISIFNIKDRANPIIDRSFTIDGNYFNSRMIGDYVYFIITNPAYLDEDEVILPTIRQGNEWCNVQAEDIWYPNVTRGWLTYHTITSINIMDPEAQITSETFLLDQGSIIYVSLDNLYIVSQGWRSESAITKIGINGGGITFMANGTVPGYILNQFSMDEYQGVLRVATTSQNWSNGREENNVYILNDELNIIGKLEDLAPGEEIYSARFIGPRCYLVTFKKIDPLFTIDLSDPENPRVLGKLKIPGYSSYLHPYDKDTLIGLGKETEESEYGDFAWYQGVKISLSMSVTLRTLGSWLKLR